MPSRRPSTTPTIRSAGRPRSEPWTPERVAAQFSERSELIKARCALGMIPDAVQGPDGSWLIPEATVRQMATWRVRPSFSIRQAAALLGVDYFVLFRRVALVSSLDDPLPLGKSVRALPFFLTPGAKPVKRVPEEELMRVMGTGNRKEGS